MAILLIVLLSALTLLSACGETPVYKVDFYADGELVETLTVAEGGTLTVPETLKSEKYTDFTDENGNPVDITKPVTTGLKIYTVTKTYKVTYVGLDGTETTETVQWGETAPRKENGGYTWKLNGEAFDFGTAVKKDLTLIADANAYDITFVLEDGETKTVSMKWGDALVPATLPEGYDDWVLDGETDAYDFKGKTVPGALSFSAKLKVFTVTMKAEEKADDTFTVKYGKPIPEDKAAVAPGYGLWMCGSKAYQGEGVKSDMVLTSALDTFTVVLKVEGNEDDTFTLKYGKEIPADKLTIAEGHLAWVTADGELYTPAPVTDNLILASNLKTFTVTLKAEEKADDTFTVKWGKTVPADKLVLGEGYEPWMAGDAAFAADTQIKDNLTLTAALKTFNVTLNLYDKDGNLEDASKTVTVKYGHTLSAADTTLADRYAAGWENDDDIDITDPVTSDLVFEAYTVTYTVTYYTIRRPGDEPEKVSSATVFHGDLLAPPSMASYYAAWSTSQTYGGAAYDMTAHVTGSLDLYASVKSASVTVIYTKALGELPAPATRRLYFDEEGTVADIVLMKAYEKVSFSEDGEALTGAEVPADGATIYVTPKVFNITYVYPADTAYTVRNASDVTAKYDITTVALVTFPDVVAKDSIFSGFLVGDASGAAITADTVMGWAARSAAAADDNAYTDLTVYVNLQAVNRDVTSEDTGLSVASGVLSVSDGTKFVAWLNSLNGAFVIPKTVDGADVTSLKLGAFAGQTAIKSLYIFDFNASGTLILDSITFKGGADKRTFNNCTALTTLVVYSDTVTSLGIGTFCMDNTGLTDATVILGAKQTAGSTWFKDCKTLKKAYIDLGSAETDFKNAYENLFSGAKALEKVTFRMASDVLGSNLFSGCSALTTAEISLPGFTGTNSSGKGANMFSGCAKLTTVTFSAPSLLTIPSSCFSGCASLEHLTLTAPSVTTVDSSAFFGCTKLTFAKGALSNVTTVNGSAFNGCTSITSLDFLDLSKIKFTTASSSAFANTGLVSVVWNVAEGSVLPASMFQGCTSLQSFVILEDARANTTELYSSVFYGCKALTKADIDFSRYPNFGSNGSNFFYNTGLVSVSITLADGVTQIPANLFSNCASLTSVKIMGKQINIAQANAFANCPLLVSVEVTNTGDVGTFTIGYGLFSGCVKLETIHLPRPTSGTYACQGNISFLGLVSLKEISNMDCYTALIINQDLQNGANNQGWWYGVSANGSTGFFPLEAPLFAVDPETGLSMWNGEILLAVSHNIFSVEEIEVDGVTQKTYTLKAQGKTAVKIPATVKHIYSGAFGGRDYDSYDKDGNVTHVYDTSVTSIDFSEATALVSIGSNAFENSMVASLVIPDSVGTIAQKAFAKTYALSSVTLPNNPNFTKLPDYLFYEAGENLKTVTIPASVTAIGNSVFERSWVEKLIYAAGDGTQITGVGSNVFANTYGNVDVDALLAGWSSLTEVPQRLFVNATGVKGKDGVITVPANFTSLGDYCFSFAGYVKITNAETGKDELVEIKDKLTVKFLAGSKKLTSTGAPFGNGGSTNINYQNIVENVILSEGLETIDGLFKNWKSVKTIVIPASVTSIKGTFNGCDNLTKITFAEDSKLTVIGDDAFFACKNLETIENLPSGITSVGKNAFAVATNNNSYSKLKLNVNWTLSSVGQYAFYNMFFLSGKITLTSDAMKNIGNYAFAFGAPVITLVKNNSFPQTADEYLGLTVNFADGALATADVVIGNYAFAHRDISFEVNGVATTALKFDSLKTLGQYAFAYNTHLTSFTADFHGAITAMVGNYAFDHAENLAAVVLGYAAATGTKSTRLTVNAYAFANIPALAYFEAPSNTKYNTNNIFNSSFTKVTAVTFKVTSAGGNTLKNDTSNYTASTGKNTPWYVAGTQTGKTVNVIIGDGITSVSAYAFCDTNATNQAKYNFFVEAATAPTMGTNPAYTATASGKYVGLDTTWEYTDEAQHVPAIKA